MFVYCVQLLDILLSWDWTNYFADFGKEQSRYLRVKPKTCIMLLEKYVSALIACCIGILVISLQFDGMMDVSN